MQMNDADDADHVNNKPKKHPVWKMYKDDSPDISMNDRKRSRSLDRGVQSLYKSCCESTTQTQSFTLVPVVRFSKIATGLKRKADFSFERQL